MTWILKLFLALTGWLILMPNAPIKEISNPIVDTNNPLNYVITIKWFDYYSDANKILNFRYNNSSWDMDLIYTFVRENWWLNINTVSHTNDYGLCQLQKNRTNAVWINDKQWTWWWLWNYQAEKCLWKRQHVANKNLWSSYKIRYTVKDRIIFMNTNK